MPFAGTTRRLLVSVAAVLGVLALAGATVAWRTAGAPADLGRPTVVAATLAAEPAPATTTSTAPPPATVAPAAAPPTTATPRPTTPTTPTTEPRPVTTAAPLRTTVAPKAPPSTAAPAQVAPVAPPVTQPVAQPAGTSAAERCAAARQWVAQRGLALPAGWGFRCPGPAVWAGTPRWGVACWNCEGNGSSWVAIDVDRIGASDVDLRYVIAHEICHAIDYAGLGLTTELTADLCAALHGVPRP